MAGYISAYKRAAGSEEPGARCEELGQALDYLTPEDMQRGDGGTEWDAALAEGKSCNKKLADSDDRFQAFTAAVSAVDSNPGPVGTAIDAYHSLNAFDRSRKRFQDDAPAVAKAKNYVKAIAASDRHLAFLSAQTAAFARSGTPTEALAVVRTLNGMTNLDRARLNGSEQSLLAAAGAATIAVGDCHAKLLKVTQASAKNDYARTPDTENNLIAAIEAVTPFDEGIATDEERQALAKGWCAAANVAWTTLRDELVARNEGTLVDDESIVVHYDFLKKIPPGALSGDQQALLTRAGIAVDKITASDARLAALATANAAWAKQGIAAGPQVLNVVAAITPFDQSRFDSAEQQAWENLYRAKVILEGPRLGFTPGSRGRMWIYVSPSNGSLDTANVADVLSARLQRAGLQVASDPKDAAVLVTVAVDAVDGPEQHPSGEFIEYAYSARLGVRASWRAGDDVLFAGEISAKGEARKEETARARALIGGADAIAGRLTSLKH